ncbi:hypothetical protein CR970_03520 [Candidatus Saccharibacteria bacterium]|nr:MAG: hypothetical protein CR970_03520 [Candidatus Saccharibacteria bacterium]
MNKVAHYLQEHLVGQVLTSPDVRRHFATDASIFSVVPAVVVYPRNENDVRKTARFTWQLAERGRVIPITARGGGSDQSGAAIGPGVILSFTAHLNRILELDGKSGNVVVEPGINYAKLQQTLHTHSRFLPPYPSSIEYSTIGGAIANNAAGEKSVKYGATRNFVRQLRVVLANGEVIETRRLSKRELNKKLGLATFEGEVYRNLDALIEENGSAIQDSTLSVTLNGAGYDLASVKRKDGSFDLTPLIVGSQGTLGIVTEATMETEVHNPHTTLVAAMFDDIQVAEQTVFELRRSRDMPSAIEMVDEHLLKFVSDHSPNLLKDVLPKPLPKMVLFIEFDNQIDRIQKRLTKKTVKLLDKYQVPYIVETDPQKKEELWKMRDSAALALSYAEKSARALPVIEDGVVPVERIREFLEAIYELGKKHAFNPITWGHIGDGNVHVQPFFDLAQVGDRQKIFRIIEEFYATVINFGGSTSAANNDGRLRALYLRDLYGEQVYELFAKVKQIFDPYGTLNAGVKIGVAPEDIKPLIRQEYSLGHRYDHMPRS